MWEPYKIYNRNQTGKTEPKDHITYNKLLLTTNRIW